MSKDVQDRLTYDSQSVALFNYLIEKKGIEKVRELVSESRKGGESRGRLVSPDWLGPDLDKAEAEWQTWIKAQKADSGGRMRMIMSGPGAGVPPPPKP
jgi:hypothetical protein